MSAVYKKEMRGYLTSMTGAIAVAVMLFVIGMMFRYYNLHYGVLTFHYTLNNSNLIFYIVVPVLSMRVFAEERRSKTDQLLLTAPVRLSEIVFGKYLALISVFAIPCLISGLYPLIMLKFGKETLKWDYMVLLAFFVMGCAYLAVGMFISSCTENVIIAAIIAILFVFMSQLISNLSALISSSSAVSMAFILVLVLLLGLLVYFMTENYWAGIGVTGVLAIACLITFIVNKSWFSGKTESILGIMDFSTRFTDFANGSFTIPNLVYFLSVIVIGVALTMQNVQKRRWS
jgi:ABC-2 type transport system permease protein